MRYIFIVDSSLAYFVIGHRGDSPDPIEIVLISIRNKTDFLVDIIRQTKLQTSFSSPLDVGNINRQLKLVAELITARHLRAQGINRDVFYVQMGGFDAHSDLDAVLKSKLPSLNTAIRNFWQVQNQEQICMYPI